MEARLEERRRLDPGGRTDGWSIEGVRDGLDDEKEGGRSAPLATIRILACFTTLLRSSICSLNALNIFRGKEIAV